VWAWTLGREYVAAVMVAVEEVLTEALSATIMDWFEPTFSHPFMNINIVSVPDAEKTIPHRWVDDVAMDDLFGGEDGDPGPLGNTGSTWSPADGRQRLMQALARLDLQEDQLAQAAMERVTRHEFAPEKRRVKQELKRYDSEFRKQFSRMPTHAEKEPMRVLYVYYRHLKTAMSQVEQNKLGRKSRTGVIGGGGSGDDMGLGGEGLTTIPDMDETPRSGIGEKQDVEDQISALEVRIESKQAEKAAVRAKLQAFQEKFVVEHNRKIHFHKDILPIEREYRTYKNLKEDIMKSEAQLRNLRAQA